MFFSNLLSGQNEIDMKTELIARIQNAQKYTLDVLNKMPEERLSYKPTEDIRSFGEIMIHIGEAQLYTLSQGVNVKQLKFRGSIKAKSDISSFLNQSYETMINAVQNMNVEDLQKKVSFWAGPLTANNVVIFTLDHVTHHRGQATIYLRMNGIKPPEYIGW